MPIQFPYCWVKSSVIYQSKVFYCLAVDLCQRYRFIILLSNAVIFALFFFYVGQESDSPPPEKKQKLDNDKQAPTMEPPDVSKLVFSSGILFCQGSMLMHRTSICGWVCWFSSLLWEVFPEYSGLPLSSKTCIWLNLIWLIWFVHDATSSEV